MKLICPKCPDQKRFYGEAIVKQVWVCNPDGSFEDIADDGGDLVEVVEEPDYFQCECEEKAIWVE